MIFQYTALVTQPSAVCVTSLRRRRSTCRLFVSLDVIIRNRQIGWYRTGIENGKIGNRGIRQAQIQPAAAAQEQAGRDQQERGGGNMGSIVPIAPSATKKNPATIWSLLLNQYDLLYPANIPYPVGLSLPKIKMIGFGIMDVVVVYASRR